MGTLSISQADTQTRTPQGKQKPKGFICISAKIGHLPNPAENLLFRADDILQSEAPCVANEASYIQYITGFNILYKLYG